MYRVISSLPLTDSVTPNAIGRHYTTSNLPSRSRGLDEYGLQTPVCPLLAQSGSDCAQQCPLLGVKRTCKVSGSMSAFDPKRTSSSCSSSAASLIERSAQLGLMACEGPKG